MKVIKGVDQTGDGGSGRRPLLFISESRLLSLGKPPHMAHRLSHLSPELWRTAYCKYDELELVQSKSRRMQRDPRG